MMVLFLVCIEATMNASDSFPRRAVARWPRRLSGLAARYIDFASFAPLALEMSASKAAISLGAADVSKRFSSVNVTMSLSP
jgi:hypothetical protein